MSGLEEDDPGSGPDALQVSLKEESKSLSAMKHSSVH